MQSNRRAFEEELGDELKSYEDKTRFKVGEPIIARLDGKNFHGWTRGLNRPYDWRLSQLMIDTTKYLMDETNALFGYTQSDEISLTWFPQNKTEPPFGGKAHKLVSLLASYCSVYFNSPFSQMAAGWEKGLEPAIFDARAFQVYNEDKGGNYFLWRYLDARKNAISMAAQEHFSPNKLHGKGSREKLVMLSNLGIVWDDYPDYFREGTFFKRVKVLKSFTTEELDRLPPKHEARANPDLKIERTQIKKVNEDIPDIISRISVYWTEFIYGDL